MEVCKGVRRVRARRANPNVDVTRGAGKTVGRHGVGAHDEKLNARHAQRGQHLDEVAAHPLPLSETPMLAVLSATPTPCARRASGAPRSRPRVRRLDGTNESGAGRESRSEYTRKWLDPRTNAMVHAPLLSLPTLPHIEAQSPVGKNSSSYAPRLAASEHWGRDRPRSGRSAPLQGRSVPTSQVCRRLVRTLEKLQEDIIRAGGRPDFLIW